MNHETITSFVSRRYRVLLSVGAVVILIHNSLSCSMHAEQPRQPKNTDIVQYQPPIQWVTVSVKNKSGNALSLQRVDFDEVKSVMQLGDAEYVQLKLASGYYVLSIPAQQTSPQAGNSRTSGSRLCWPVPADAKLTRSLKMTISQGNCPEYLKNDWSYIPAGPAVVGDVIGLGREEERPARIVNVDAFLMGRYEVSNQQYADFLNDQDNISRDWIDLRSRKCLIRRSTPVGSPDKEDEYRQSPTVFVTTSPKMPVVMVSRKGALNYCEWLTQKTNVVHRLATEAEWEKSARGPESFLYSYGNICRISGANQESGHLCKTGQFPPNGFGLYDMTGNCFEWVSGEFATTTRLTGLLRGGSFMFDGIYNRVSFRMR